MMTDTGAPIQAFHGRQVEALAGFGIPDDEIAHVLRIEPGELLQRYAPELTDGRIKANSKVAESLFRKATGEGAQFMT
jgi:hypothetical protein